MELIPGGLGYILALVGYARSVANQVKILGTGVWDWILILVIGSMAVAFLYELYGAVRGQQG